MWFHHVIRPFLYVINRRRLAKNGRNPVVSKHQIHVGLSEDNEQADVGRDSRTLVKPNYQAQTGKGERKKTCSANNQAGLTTTFEPG